MNSIVTVVYVDTMADESVKKDIGIEDLFDMADREGVAVATVKDGHMLVFSEGHLERMLELCKSKGQKKIAVFVQHREFKN